VLHQYPKDTILSIDLVDILQLFLKAFLVYFNFELDEYVVLIEQFSPTPITEREPLPTDISTLLRDTATSREPSRKSSTTLEEVLLWPKSNSETHTNTRQMKKPLLQQKECTLANFSTVDRKVSNILSQKKRRFKVTNLPYVSNKILL
jgi:hypothetical protein